jgi:hypothetical protein
MRAAFDLALMGSTAARPAHAHTQVRVRSNLPCEFERIARCTTCARHECGRTYSSWAFRDLLLGHFSPISPSFFPVGRTPLHSRFSIPPPKSLPKHPNHRPTTPRPIAGPSLTSPLTADRPLAGFSSFPIFLPENPFFSNSSFFFSVFLVDCGFCIVCGWFWVCFCRGLGCFERGFQTLWILGAHQVFEEIPQPTLIMPRGRGSSSRSTGTQGIVARQPIESRRLILENTFAIKEEFSNNEATSWAVRELKR